MKYYVSRMGGRSLRAGFLTGSGHLLISPKTLDAAAICVISLIGGAFGGLLGIGGGSAIAPLLLLRGKLRPPQVSGTTLATVLVISVVGSGAYASLGNLNFGLAWPIALGSVVGAIAGALSSRRLPGHGMLLIFVVILPYFAAKEFWPSLAAPDMATHIFTLGLLGLGAGFLSGLLGISGASLVVPSLVAFFLIDHHVAQGVAMTVALSDSLAGTVTHARGKSIDHRIFLLMAVPALIGALSGALLSDALSVWALRHVFGTFMVVIWGLMILHLMSRATWRSAPETAPLPPIKDLPSPHGGTAQHPPPRSTKAHLSREAYREHPPQSAGGSSAVENEE